MNMRIGKVIDCAIEYLGNDARRINHFMKVHGFAKTIGELEHLPEKDQEILEVTAVLHDIGIKLAEEKYNSSAGNYQELEGPAVAEGMLKELGYGQEFIERVKFLIGHHHTYTNIEGMDYQILVEADFIVNIYEDGMEEEAAKKVLEKIFRTSAGTKLMKNMYIKEEI